MVRRVVAFAALMAFLAHAAPVEPLEDRSSLFSTIPGLKGKFNRRQAGNNNGDNSKPYYGNGGSNGGSNSDPYYNNGGGANGGGNYGQEPVWELTWMEDWKGFSGATPKCWIPRLGTGYKGGPENWGTQEVETMTADEKNLFVDYEGALNIVPVRDEYGKWTSSRIETGNDRFHGANPGGMVRIEANIFLPEIRLENALGIWPAFWTMGKKFRDNGPMSWPMSGEVDILENVNGLEQVHFTVHCGVAPGGPCDEYNGKSGKGPLARGRYHVFSMEVDRRSHNWEEQTINWSVDNVWQHTLKSTEINDKKAWEAVAHQGLFVILNVAMGGAFPNALNENKPTPTNATISGVGMKVEWVKVWNVGGAWVEPPSDELQPPVEGVEPPSGELQPPVEGPKPPSGELEPPIEGVKPPSGELQPPVEDVQPPSGDLRPPVEDSQPLVEGEEQVTKQ